MYTILTLSVSREVTVATIVLEYSSTLVPMYQKPDEGTDRNTDEGTSLLRAEVIERRSGLLWLHQPTFARHVHRRQHGLYYGHHAGSRQWRPRWDTLHERTWGE